MTTIHAAVRDIAHAALDPAAALALVDDPRFGGIDLFVGRVRQHNLGRRVIGVSYDIHPRLAPSLFRGLATEVMQQFGPALKLYVEHAHGRLGVGDTAVVVAAGAPHRDEAFRACRALIEAIKHRAPIWKQEHYLDGSSVWSEGCSLCAQGVPAHPPSPPVEATAHGH